VLYPLSYEGETPKFSGRDKDHATRPARHGPHRIESIRRATWHS
jgi:hypothetical protein